MVHDEPGPTDNSHLLPGIYLSVPPIAGHPAHLDLAKSRAHHASSAYVGDGNSFVAASSKMLNHSW